ncbi:MAG: NHLP leader peptide family RiPP precursor [Holophaga sp.]|jgi:hypothetical protein
MNGTVLLESPDRVIAKAWADEEFKAALMADPRAALKAQGIEVPEGVTLNVLENSDNVINLVLPKAPEMGLTEETLGTTSMDRCGGCGGCGCGGGCGCIPCVCTCM